MNGEKFTEDEQKNKLIEIIKLNTEIKEILDILENINLPEWYVGAGCITQSVWNYISGKDLMYGIKDIDIIYYDATDLSYSKEDEIRKMVKRECASATLEVDVINEARVHLWYKEKFGVDLKQYVSTEDAIDAWPTTATTLGVRKDGNEYKVYAPLGLDDVFSGTIRANKKLITKDFYESKADKWTKKWDFLKVVPW